MSDQFSNLNVADSNANPWEASNEQKATLLPAPPPLERKDSGNEAWSSVPPPARASPTAPLSEPPTLINIDDTHDSPTWDDDEDLFPAPTREKPTVQEEDNAWEDVAREAGRQGVATAPVATSPVATSHDDFVREDGGWEALEPTEPTPQVSGIVDADGHEYIPRPVPARPPHLPPRQSTEIEGPEMPPRPAEGDAGGSSRETPNQGRSAQEKETYEIKKIAWYDARSQSNPRISPVLTQNANGPCPLLALVNALTLSTPPELITPLIETLRTREQVSLELLLNAVFDELMSGRRGDGTQQLPDVSDLYAFLVALHTGMNVNPRFIPPAPTNLMDDPQPSAREEAIPGTFEETREMKLYGTFSIPLIHGWLPPPESPAYAALSRSARTYEDAQHLMFREEELETKLQHDGLSFEEQATLEDISTIKAFFASSATQLTPHGLATIQTSLGPGGVAILFRNDHFSTLYKHPESAQLLHLVTDKGYAGHEEVVWESLVDTTGENCEFFSGDFRLVGGNPHHQPSSTPAARSPQSPAPSSSPSSSSSSSQGAPSQDVAGIDATLAGAQPQQTPNTEQEDHDLALAMQLQEEEDSRHRVETERRRRETQLSQDFIQQQGLPSTETIPVTRLDSAGRRASQAAAAPGGRRNMLELQRPVVPPRRSGTAAAAPESGPGADGAARVDPEAGVDVPPPSYEQAATEPRYEPAVGGGVAVPQASPGRRAQRGGGRRQSGQAAAALRVQQERERERECVVM